MLRAPVILATSRPCSTCAGSTAAVLAVLFEEAGRDPARPHPALHRPADPPGGGQLSRVDGSTPGRTRPRRHCARPTRRSTSTRSGDDGRLAPSRHDHGLGLAHPARARPPWRSGPTSWPARPRWSGSSTCRWPSWPTRRSSTRSVGAFPGATIPGTDDNSFPVWFFEVSGEMIWGATARMLYELLTIVLVGRAR